ncbi:MAG: isocitrate lyase/PEP mutase family protein [Acidimicrobiia bacterium]|nr:isocitrate lyase/PEP mutase family protein [Acidimicrobiia bacterium]
MRGRAQVDAPARLRALLDEGLVVAPFVFDALQALAAEQAGARAVHLTGFGMAASHGDPDVGLVGLREIVAAAGVTAIHIEDQHWPKRCGFFAGKEVVAVGEMEAKVRAAVDAAGPGGAVVIARTDALAPLGWREAESRARRCHDAGAELLFVDGLATPADAETCAERLGDLPLVYNGLLPAERVAALGFRSSSPLPPCSRPGGTGATGWPSSCAPARWRLTIPPPSSAGRLGHLRSGNPSWRDRDVHRTFRWCPRRRSSASGVTGRVLP